jgi:selenocysteine lyase/cysteine desulfurase
MDYVGDYTLKPSAARYEYGTRALADFAGFHRAVQWMDELGFERIEQRIEDLVSYAIEGTKEYATLDVASPEDREDRSGVFVIRLPEGCDTLDAYQRLAEDQSILTSPVRHERDLRIAIHFFNTRNEIDAALKAVNDFCGSRGAGG